MAWKSRMTGAGKTVAGHGGLFQIVALALLGLRDKTVFLAARGEHYGLNDHFSYVVAVR